MYLAEIDSLSSFALMHPMLCDAEVLDMDTLIQQLKILSTSVLVGTCLFRQWPNKDFKADSRYTILKEVLCWTSSKLSSKTADFILQG